MTETHIDKRIHLAFRLYNFSNSDFNSYFEVVNRRTKKCIIRMLVDIRSRIEFAASSPVLSWKLVLASRKSFQKDYVPLPIFIRDKVEERRNLVGKRKST